MSATPLPEVPVAPETMLPDLLQRYPQARVVFDRYGLSGCGGRFGPPESIRFFARAHGVDEATLLAELERAVARPQPTVAVIPPPEPQDTLYRRFFLAGIATILTAGATWGMILLWRIGFGGSFTGVSIFAVNAHGHAQIYGWVGLFIMGFAYQAFPRIWHTRLVFPRLADIVFGLMLTGIVVRTIGMGYAESAAWALPVALLGGGLELAAVVLFVGQIGVTFRRSGAALEPYVGFVLTALVWFVAMAAMSLWHTYRTMSAASEQSLLAQVATWQAPLRDLQIHGLALFMILGVSLRMLPGLYDLPKVPDRRAWAGLAVLTAALCGEIASFVAYRLTGDHRWAGLLWLAWLALAAGCVAIVLPWRLWRPFPEGDRSEKFIRFAWAWLFVSLAMLLAFPVYQAVSGQPFSHAYYGAIRHAITVGFISLMIMGYGAKVVPTLNGIDPAGLSPLWGPFALINVGCLLRVTTQTLTDFHPGFFAVVGISGTLEVIALAWWGGHLTRLMLAGRRAWELPRELGPRPARIEAEQIVADVLAWYPATLAVFLAHGFAPLANPALRHTLARRVTIRRAAALRGVDLDALLAALNQTIDG